MEIEATAYPQITYQVEDAVRDPDVSQIHLHIDSPGGTVAGGLEVADVIYAARKSKPVHAYVEDLAASGAYWLASQSDTITANANARIGSIGVFTVYTDASGMADDLGLKVHVIRSGEHKGVHIPGVKITDEQLAALQEQVDDLANNFIKAVARGRGLLSSDIKVLATGQCWIAAKAKSRGLIDNIGSKIQTKRKDSNMSTEKNEVEVDVEALQKVASESAVKGERERFTALQTAFPGESEFVSKHFAAGSTVDVAKIDYVKVVEAKLEASQKVNAELRAQLATVTVASNKVEGADAVTQEGDPSIGKADFMTLVHEYAAENKVSAADAVRAVRLSDPESHKTYVGSN